MKLKVVLLGMALSAMVLANDEHAGGHADEGHHGMEAHHQREHGMAGHHGPDMWNAPPEAAARPNPVPATAESLARGEEVFEHNCVVCHGPAGKGDGPLATTLNPPPADLQYMTPLHPPGDLAWKIAEGRGPMPSWKDTLREQQIWDTVNYLQYGFSEAEASGSTAALTAGDTAAMDHSKMNQNTMDHSKMDHGSRRQGGQAMGGEHAGHPMSPAVTAGPWSYQDRDNPKPYRDNRWEMVPVPGYGHMYINTQGLSQELRCAAIADNPRIMVDRQTRTTCGQTPPPLDRSQPPAHGDHGQH